MRRSGESRIFRDSQLPVHWLLTAKKHGAALIPCTSTASAVEDWFLAEAYPSASVRRPRVLPASQDVLLIGTDPSESPIVLNWRVLKMMFISLVVIPPGRLEDLAARLGQRRWVSPPLCLILPVLVKLVWLCPEVLAAVCILLELLQSRRRIL